MDSNRLPQSSVSVSFATEGRDAGNAVSVSMDEAKNIDVHGQQKTVFAPGESAYLKMIEAGEARTTLHSSAGAVSRVASNILYPHAEDIIFAMDRSGSLRYLPTGPVTWTWLGKNGGTPLFSGRSVTLPAPVAGVLRCEYTVSGSRFRLLVNPADMGGEEQITVVVVAVKGTAKASAAVRYSALEGAGGEPLPMDLEVSDFCSGETVDEVAVYMDGESKGTTNTAGKVYLGELIPGSIHQLKMTRAGYIDSDLDVLYNDEFTVPAS